MQSPKVLAIMAMVVSAACAQAQAQDGDRNESTVWGAGWTSCGKVVSFANSQDSISLGVIVTWSQGYLSSENSFLTTSKVRTLRYVDPESIQAYLVKYCRENPLQRAYDGVQRLSLELAR